jgi:hypothetical protein
VATLLVAEQPGRLETGRIAMGAQFIAGEVMRQITGNSFRNMTEPSVERMYPRLDGELWAIGVQDLRLEACSPRDEANAPPSDPHR